MAGPERVTEQPTTMFHASVEEAPDPSLYPELSFDPRSYNERDCREMARGVYSALRKKFGDDKSPFKCVIEEIEVFNEEVSDG